MKKALAIAVLLVLAVAAALAPAAEAKTAFTDVSIGKVALAPLPHGRSALLVRVAYPISLLGRRLGIEVFVDSPAGAPQRLFGRQVALSGGLQRTPERRGRFRFIHQVVLDAAQTKIAREAGRVGVRADGSLDVDHDGVPELSATGQDTRPLGGSGAPACATVPLLRSYYSHRVSTKLPVCTTPIKWRVKQGPEHGTVRIRDGWLRYVPAAKYRGTDTLELAGSPVGGAGASAAPIPEPVVVKVGSAAHAVVRAMGDSVTAGFGYYEEGASMPFTSLYECKPGGIYNDACSSNSSVRKNTAEKVVYSPDYGLANDVSWAAQWANEHGITNYKNFAITGSEPVDWAPGGRLYAATRQIEGERPEYILMTIGANPLLSEMLFGVDNMGCAIWSDFFEKYDLCIEEAFAEVKLRLRLAALYKELLSRTGATIFLMQYPVTIPSTALAYTSTQIAEMGRLLNREIASVAGSLNPTRLQVVAPEHFNVGLDISPVYPAKYKCRLGYYVDGPSVQTTATQDELEIHPSFCSGPRPPGPEWVISGDTGIHPSATGYSHMASQVPAPE
ncbi:MAG TPA: Ig-like domain-containing protein [Solirubrobacterales bacterium]|nr:Ig-like domain-containing protein [Solirubrobacterales bacterium]